MQIGRTGLNVEALKDISENDFRKLFIGQAGLDVDKAWKDFKKEAKQYKKPKKKN
tara:strand:- start:421 stop:585 length:165 start_codon:yes stop_codon:yes gene_type:complete